MAGITKKEILHIAKLAKFDLKESEVDKFSKQLSEVVNHVSELSSVDTKNIQPTSQTTGLENVYRLDEVDANNCLSQESAIDGTDQTYNGYFKVKAILKDRTDK